MCASAPSVSPTGHGWHPGLLGPFEVLEFEQGRPIVHLEHWRSSSLLHDEEDDLHAYVDATARLGELALSPEQSAALIAETITTLETSP